MKLKKEFNMANWHKKFVYGNCKKCGIVCETKNRFYAICKKCVKEYLESLEEMARKARKTNKPKKEKERDYRIIYNKINKQRESLVGVPRSIEVKTYNRQCLNCNKDFVGYGKYNRICESCKTNNEGTTDLCER